MAKFIKDYEGWIQWIIVLIFIIGNLYLNSNYCTKKELAEHLESDSKAHLLINDKLNLLIEYNVKQNVILTRMDDHEIRIRFLEKVAAQNHQLQQSKN